MLKMYLVGKKEQVWEREKGHPSGKGQKKASQVVLSLNGNKRGPLKARWKGFGWS